MRGRLRSVRIILLLLAIAVSGVMAYRYSGHDEPAQPTVYGTIDFVELESALIERGGEWRDVRLLPAGAHKVSLGNAKPDGVVRLGFSLRGIPRSTPRVSVFAGETELAEVSIADTLSWTDQRIALPSDISDAAACTVRFATEVPLLISTCEQVPITTDRPNILVFLIDTLRRDHLGCYGYGRDTSPHIDALAKEGIRFDTMISQSSWTRPAVASLLTSTYPAVHGAKDRSDIVRPDITRLAQVLRDEGYATEGFMTNPTCLPMWGFGLGFSRYVDVQAYAIDPAKDADLADRTIEAVGDLTGRPWFIYAHAIGPHNPYEPPAPYDRKFTKENPKSDDERSRTVNLYDGEIGFTDAQFGRVIDELKRLDQYNNTAIVVIADHGEQFWEHGELGHGISLHDEEVRIPFILKLPKGDAGGTVISDTAEIIDVAPTLLDIAALDPPATFQGQTLMPVVRGEAAGEDAAYSSLFLEKHSAYSARSQQFKYINYLAERRTDWFDLVTDRAEQNPLPLAPDGAAYLAGFASRVSVIGGDGLHILVTGSLNDPHTITGTVYAEGVGEINLRYDANNGETESFEDGFHFRVSTVKGPNTPADLVNWHEEGAEQNNAHIRAELDLAGPIRVELALDGEPIPAEMVHVGPSLTERSLSDGPLAPSELVAPNSDAFAPQALPRKLAVYLWYIPSAESISDENLDPGMAEALHSLGYL